MKKPVNLLLLVLFVISAALAVYFYQEMAKIKENPQAVAQEETQRLIEQVGRLIVLPQDEAPTVATISDVEKLKDQPFFANAQNGYKILIYTKAKKAILYDPVSNKIVEVAPVNLGNNQGGTGTAPVEEPTEETTE